jgi:photosystem II stability/assembly factor-like uncharacterized protein
MKNFLRVLFFFLLETQICFAQWYQQNSDTTFQLEDVCFTDANHGTIVGWINDLAPSDVAGIILRTTDGGQSWFTKLIYPSTTFRGVHFVDANTGTAVGDYGEILRTTDGGNHWITQTSGTVQHLHDVYFTDVNTGTAVGYAGKILRTTNGGNNWTLQSSDTTCEYEGVCFTDGNTGTVVGSIWNGTYVEGIVLRTVDGGLHWTRQLATNDYIHCYLNDVCFIDANTGTVVGRGEKKTNGTYGGIIIRTSDAGIIGLINRVGKWSVLVECTSQMKIMD